MARPIDVRAAPRSDTMNASNLSASRATSHQLRFRSLFHEGRGWAFPCDASGRVDLDSLSETARNNYFYARTLIGRDVAAPAVQLAS
jgi:hypothetical protein